MEAAMTMDQLAAKRLSLRDLIAELGSVVVAYSGGVDSSFLAAMAHERLGRGSLAVTAVSPSLARRELDQARALAVARGWQHRVVPTHEVAREDYARNDPDRCYWCKTELYGVLGPLAAERDAKVLVGTNLDDLGDYRPGLRAADENGVIAPLVQAGLTKSDVRVLSGELGLPTADKPASPCLASRFAYGVRVTPQGLRRIDAAEEAVRALGFEVLRVRDHGDLARIELPVSDISRAAERSAEIAASLKDLGFKYVALDLEGFRSGAMNEVLPAPRFGAP